MRLGNRVQEGLLHTFVSLLSAVLIVKELLHPRGKMTTLQRNKVVLIVIGIALAAPPVSGLFFFLTLPLLGEGDDVVMRAQHARLAKILLPLARRATFLADVFHGLFGLLGQCGRGVPEVHAGQGLGCGGEQVLDLLSFVRFQIVAAADVVQQRRFRRQAVVPVRPESDLQFPHVGVDDRDMEFRTVAVAVQEPPVVGQHLVDGDVPADRKAVQRQQAGAGADKVKVRCNEAREVRAGQFFGVHGSVSSVKGGVPGVVKRTGIDQCMVMAACAIGWQVRQVVVAGTVESLDSLGLVDQVVHQRWLDRVLGRPLLRIRRQPHEHVPVRWPVAGELHRLPRIRALPCDEGLDRGERAGGRADERIQRMQLSQHGGADEVAAVLWRPALLEHQVQLVARVTGNERQADRCAMRAVTLAVLGVEEEDHRRHGVGVHPLAFRA